MAASLKLLPGSTVRWRGRRYLIVDYQSLDAIIARQPGKRRLERIPVNEAAPDQASHIVSGRTPDLVSVPEKAWQTAVKRFEILKPLLNMGNSERTFVHVKKAARALGKHPATVYRWIDYGRSELIEACTDPNINTIIVQGGPGSACPDPTGNCEIGDVCSSVALVGGVQVQSYWSKVDNSCIIPQNIINGEMTGNPVLIQGRFLHPGNFEMACPLKGDGLSHYSRMNSIDFVPWFGPEVFATDIGEFDAISMIQSNFTTGPGIGNLEVAALFLQSHMLYYWREDVPPYIWHGPETMNAFQQQLFTGNPVLIQGRFEHRGNFEMVVPLASGGIAHYSRANDLAGVPWFGPNVFATELGIVEAVTMIQSNWTVGPDIGLLEVIARVGGNLFYYFREDDPPYKWWGPLQMNGFQPQLFTGNPVLIESRFGEARILN